MGDDVVDTGEAWSRVADRLSALALKLKLHADEELSRADLSSKVGFDKARAAVNEALDGIQAASDDEAVRADARDAKQAFLDAVDATVREVERRLRSDGTSSSG
ncbi:MAG TPA: hypothetical protein VFZ70_05005 [Euzebyales bacterium]